MDINKRPVTISFDLVDDCSPLVIGMDLSQYLDRGNKKWPLTINFQRPHDMREYTLYKYIAEDHACNRRMKIYVATHEHTKLQSLLATVNKRKERNMAKNHTNLVMRRRMR